APPAPDAETIAVATEGAVPSILMVEDVVEAALPAASAPKYCTVWPALSPATLNVALAPAVDVCPAPSTLRVTEPMPVPLSTPLTDTETDALYQPAPQAAALQV